MKSDIQVGQMLVVHEMMDVYPRRAESKLEASDMLFDAFNDKVCPGDVLTVVERSAPRFPRDDTWYRVITQGGLVAWLRSCHRGVFYDVVPTSEPNLAGG